MIHRKVLPAPIFVSPSLPDAVESDPLPSPTLRIEFH